MGKIITIIRLGEIITPTIENTLAAFTQACQGQHNDTREIAKKIGGVLNANLSLINAFKEGKINDAEFTAHMILALKAATGVLLKVEQFDAAWHAMNPDFSNFELSLKALINFNNRPNQQIILISYTNPKDIDHLRQQLKKNNVPYVWHGNTMTEIAGIPLHTSFAAHQNIPSLIANIVKKLKQNSGQGIFKQCAADEIVYISAENKNKEAALKADLDKTNQEINSELEKNSVKIVLWDKANIGLTEILEQSPQHRVELSKLSLNLTD